MISLALILGLGLRLISLNQSLWLDEATSALTTKMSLRYFFFQFITGDFHPPLYYLTLRPWSTLFGSSEIALRSLSVLFGTATIYLVYLIGRKMFNEEVGIITALLLATSSLHVYYSQEARMYSMSAFLVCLAIYLFLKISKAKSSPKDWIIFSLIIGLIGLTDYLSLLILPVFWIFAILTKQKSQWWKKFSISQFVSVALLLPWLPTFVKQLTSGINVTNNSPAWTSVLGILSIKDILLIPVKFAIGRISFDNKILYALIIGFIFLIFAALISKSLNNRKKAKLLFLWLIVPLGSALVISLKLPILNYFRFLFVLPSLYLIISFGITNYSKKLKVMFIFSVILLNLGSSYLYLTNQKFQREDWRGLAISLENSQAVALFPSSSQHEALEYYHAGSKIININQLNKGYKEIWLIRYVPEIADPSDSTRQKVENLGYQKTGELNFNAISVWRYNMSALYAANKLSL